MDFKSLFSNWRTTAIGAGAFLAALANILNEIGSGKSFGEIMTGPVISQLFLGLMGLVAKDGVVTGGTVSTATVANPATLVEKK